VARRDSTRQALIDATAKIMLEDGYAGASSRRVAAMAGVRPALVHYYFPTMDDLFIAVLRAGGDVSLSRQQESLGKASPLHALWHLNSARNAQLWMEFMALANHRKAIGVEIASYAERIRDAEEAAVAAALRAHGVDVGEFPPVVMSMVIASLARIVLLEEGVGISRGHAEAKEFIARCLDRFELPS
jgi:AcrR family transcriptional regulator